MSIYCDEQKGNLCVARQSLVRGGQREGKQETVSDGRVQGINGMTSQK